MDLIYMNSNLEDVGVMKDFAFDLAFGADENDFECRINRNMHCCEGGYFLYMEGTEYGGIIDDIETDTDANEIVYHGRTWHGILNSKILEPPMYKNLIPFPYYDKTKTVNGVTFTVNDDGSVTANGTATAGATFTAWHRNQGLLLEKGKTYRMSDGFTGTYARISVTFYNGSERIKEIIDTGNGTIFTMPTDFDYDSIAIYLWCIGGKEANNVVFYPMITEVAEDGSYPTEYIQPGKTLKKDYLILSGEANSVLASLLARMSLTALFSASNDDSGINISNYKMNRYIGGYDGIRKMLKSVGAKLNISFNNGFVELSAIPFVDYSSDEQFDSDLMCMKIKNYYNPVNHLICLGKGELSEREVIHLYADKSGNISHTQSITGIDEVVQVYDYSSVESSEELESSGIQTLKDLWNMDSIETDFDLDSKSFDVGDIVGGIDQETGIAGKAEITKKIVSISENETNITYKVGE